MKKTAHEKIAKYYFQDSQRLVYATPLGNVLLVLVFLMANSKQILTNPYLVISLLTSILFLIICQIYNWQIHWVNSLIIGLYLLIFLIEIIFYGIPPYGTGNSGKKGVMMEIFISLMPFVYTGLRFIFLIPLIQITYASFQLRKIRLN